MIVTVEAKRKQNVVYMYKDLNNTVLTIFRKGLMGLRFRALDQLANF